MSQWKQHSIHKVISSEIDDKPCVSHASPCLSQVRAEMLNHSCLHSLTYEFLTASVKLFCSDAESCRLM